VATGARLGGVRWARWRHAQLVNLWPGERFPVLSGNVPGTVRAYVVVMREAELATAPVPVTTEVAARRFGVASSAAAAVLVAGAVLLAAGSVPLYAMTHQNVLVNGGQNIAVAMLFSAVGFVVVRRQPRNPIGWILLTVPAGLQLLPADAASYALLAYRLGHRLPFGAVALLLEYSWAPAIVLLGLAILLFPDGRLPSPRWRPVLWSYLAVVACDAGGTYALAATALAARRVRVDSGGGLTAISSATFYWLIFPVLAAFWLSFIAAQVLSWRRSSGERRQQLKWLMSGAAVLAVSQVIFQLLGHPESFGRSLARRCGGRLFGIIVRLIRRLPSTARRDLDDLHTAGQS
jgi:hypothetical protein